jgi:hypothetical protein
LLWAALARIEMQQQLDAVRERIAADWMALRSELDDARAELRAVRA